MHDCRMVCWWVIVSIVSVPCLDVPFQQFYAQPVIPIMTNKDKLRVGMCISYVIGHA